MQEVELAHGECSHPPLHDDVSDGFLFYFYDYYIYEDYDDINSYPISPIQPKQAEKTLEAAGNLAGNPLDPRKTRSQFHTALSAREVNISQKLFIMVVYYP